MTGTWWLWIPITLFASGAQVARNASQRQLQGEIGTLGATFVRFVFAIPFSFAWLAVLFFINPPSDFIFSFHYFAWLLVGSISQIMGTALMLKAMDGEHFTLATAYVKTEVLQVTVFGIVFLAESIETTTILAVIIATISVLTLSLQQSGSSSILSNLRSRAAMYGLASGAAFAISTVGFKGATISLGSDFLLTAAFSVVVSQVLQTVLMTLYFLKYKRGLLTRIFSTWRRSSVVGISGACASVGWFTAMAIEPIAHVRTLALIEVLISYVISVRLFKEQLQRAQIIAVILLTISVGVVTLGSKLS
jgi:drug/metabolite transporter (DMT)-like permease